LSRRRAKRDILQSSDKMPEEPEQQTIKNTVDKYQAFENQNKGISQTTGHIEINERKKHKFLKMNSEKDECMAQSRLGKTY